MRRGFDSLVQTATGLNASEAAAAAAACPGDSQAIPARPLPCQALDHSAGYFLATGILAALYMRERDRQVGEDRSEGGGYDVNVSLEGSYKLLHSLGRIDDPSVFTIPPLSGEDIEDFLEETESTIGSMRAVSHAGMIGGCEGGFKYLPRPLGSDAPAW